MRVLGLYLWKEWRDQSAGLIGLLAALPLLLGIACVVCRAPALDEMLRPGLAAAGGALIALVGLGTDLIPGERRRARVQFLERLPAGLRRAFAAKLVFFSLITLLVTAYAGLIALGLSVLRHGTLPESFLGAIEERSVLPAIAWALWIVSVSTWVPPGALSFPAAAVVATLLCSPAWYFYGPSSILTPTLAELRAFCVLCALASGASAWVSFVRGYRWGASPARAMRSGAIVAVLCLSPAWIWSSYRLHAARTFDPADAAFLIEDAYLGEGGRCVLMNACEGECDSAGAPRNRCTRVVVVDLGTSAWRAVRDENQEFWPGDLVLRAPGQSGFPRLRTAFVQSAEKGSGVVALDASGRETGRPARREIFHSWPSAGDLGLDEHTRVFGWFGLGHGVAAHRGEDRSNGYYDPFRCRVFRTAELFPDSEERVRACVSIRPGRWLVRRAMNAPYELLDPYTLDSMPVDLSREEHLGPVLDDGRYLITSGGDVLVFDPQTGARERLTILGRSSGPIDIVVGALLAPAPISAFDPPVVVLSGPDGCVLARLDLERGELVPASGSRGFERLVACESSASAIAVEDNRRLVRLHFGSGEREVLWPPVE